MCFLFQFRKSIYYYANPLTKITIKSLNFSNFLFPWLHVLSFKTTWTFPSIMCQIFKLAFYSSLWLLSLTITVWCIPKFPFVSIIRIKSKSISKCRTNYLCNMAKIMPWTTKETLSDSKQHNATNMKKKRRWYALKRTHDI